MNRVSAAAVLSVGGALLLAGCVGDPSTAAVVDGRTITRDQLDAAVEDLAAGNGESSGQILWALAVAPLYIEAADAERVGVSSEEARTALGDPEVAGGADGVVSDATVEIARYLISAENLASAGAEDVLQEVDERAAALDIRANPRYGDVDAAGQTFQQAPVPWIVDPAADVAEG